MRLRLRFWVQKLLSTVNLLHKLLQQSIPPNFLRIEVWRAHWMVKKSYFLFKQVFLCYWCIILLKNPFSPHRRCPSCARDKSFSIFTICCFFWPLTNCISSFPKDEKPLSAPTTDHKKFSSQKFFACQYFWKPSGPSKLNFFAFKTTFHHSLALRVWYRRAYPSHFTLCFIVNLGQWILFLCLIFSLFKCLLIVLVLKGVFTRDFNIFDVDKVCFFFYFMNNSSLELWW